MSTKELLNTGRGSRIDPNDIHTGVGLDPNEICEAASKGPALTTEELATRWNVTPTSLEQLRHRKAGPPFFKIVHRVRYFLADVLQWETDHRHLDG